MLKRVYSYNIPKIFEEAPKRITNNIPFARISKNVAEARFADEGDVPYVANRYIYYH